MDKKDSKKTPGFKFFYSLFLLPTFSAIPYIISIQRYIAGKDSFLSGIYGVIYIGLLVIIPFISFGIYRKAKLVSNRCLSVSFVVNFFVTLFISLVTQEPWRGVVITYLAVSCYMWIPVSWYNFKENRWEEK